MSAPQILTPIINGKPKTVVISVYLSHHDMSFGGHRTLRISRVSATGRIERFNLEIDIPSNAVEGTVFTFERMGDYLNNGDYQSINVVIKASDYSHQPTDFGMEFNASALPVYGAAQNSRPPQNDYYAPQQQQYRPTAPPAPDYYSQPSNNNNFPSMPFTPNCIPFPQLRVHRKGDYDISYLPNGDIAVQIRVSINDFGTHKVDFRKILDDGSVLMIRAADMNVIGVPEYKTRLYTPVNRSVRTGNVHLLIISDIEGSIDCSGLCWS